LSARDDDAEPVERFFRDSRINTIFEGSSEIMRLFIAREALDPHLKVAGALFNSQLPRRTRVAALMKATVFYLRWYPSLFIPRRFKSRNSTVKVDRPLLRHLRFIERCSRRLARHLFHEMLRHGPKLEREQLVLGRLVDIAAELFAMSAACAQAMAMEDASGVSLADAFCADARVRVEAWLRSRKQNADQVLRRTAKALLENQFQEHLGISVHEPKTSAVELPRQAA